MTDTPACLPGPQPPAGQRFQATRLALLAGSTSALVSAGVLGCVLALANKWACRAGAWNGYLTQFQAHCYTDIYPLYFNEGLSAGKVPYADHPVEYPVLIGGAMQLAAWLVRPITNPFVRGREFFDVTIAALSIFFVLGVLATAYLAGLVPAVDRARRRVGPRGHPGRVHQLGPDRDGPGHAGHRRLGGAPRRAGRACSSGWPWRPSSIRVLFLGPLLLLCWRACLACARPG